MLQDKAKIAIQPWSHNESLRAVRAERKKTSMHTENAAVGMQQETGEPPLDQSLARIK